MQQLRVSRSSHPEFADPNSSRLVRVGSVEFGGPHAVMIAGPCAVESYQQTLEIAWAAKAAGAQMLRGGAFKPRTSPYAFQGLGEDGLKILAVVSEQTGMPVVTEVMDPRKVALVARYADMLQIGSRSMQNFPLLIEAGMSGKPVLLKRGFAATLEEWLYAAEYIALQGNLDVVMCERGIRAFSLNEYARNTLDLNVIGPLKQATFLPLIVDPSHATGCAHMVPAASYAAIAGGAQGLMIEVIGERTDRKSVLCDGAQGVVPSVLRELIASVRSLESQRMCDLAEAK